MRWDGFAQPLLRERVSFAINLFGAELAIRFGYADYVKRIPCLFLRIATAPDMKFLP